MMCWPWDAVRLTASRRRVCFERRRELIAKRWCLSVETNRTTSAANHIVVCTNRKSVELYWEAVNTIQHKKQVSESFCKSIDTALPTHLSSEPTDIAELFFSLNDVNVKQTSISGQVDCFLIKSVAIHCTHHICISNTKQRITLVSATEQRT